MVGVHMASKPLDDATRASVKAAADAARELDPLDRQILDFFYMAGRRGRDKEIRRSFDMNTVAFDQRVNRLLDDPRALAYAPMTVNRLRRQREEKQQRRRRTQQPYPR